MFKRKCKITFISHGATIYSTAGIIGNDLKYPKLNDFGEDEINKVCEYLKERGVAYDNIYTCPNACCSQSAQVIASLFKQKVKTLELLPRNYGKWHGLLYSDILKNNGPEVLAQTPEDGGLYINLYLKISVTELYWLQLPKSFNQRLQMH